MAHAGRKNKYNLMFINHKLKFHPGNNMNMALVNPMSECRLGIISRTRNEASTGGINIAK